MRSLQKSNLDLKWNMYVDYNHVQAKATLCGYSCVIYGQLIVVHGVLGPDWPLPFP